MIEKRMCIRVDGGTRSAVWDSVAEEAQLELCINDRPVRTVSLSPCHVREFIVGHLFSEGYIGGMDDITSIRIEGRLASVGVREVSDKENGDHTGTGAAQTDGAVKRGYAQDGRGILVLRADAVFRAMRMLLDSDAHRATGGFHRAGIFCQDGTAWMAEDIGRHNAMDKAIGHCLLERIDLSRVFAVLTSRISSGLALKCSRAGIPVLASRGAPTGLSIDISDAAGITLLGFVRGERMNIYTHPERIWLSPADGCERV